MTYFSYTLISIKICLLQIVLFLQIATCVAIVLFLQMFVINVKDNNGCVVEGAKF